MLSQFIPVTIDLTLLRTCIYASFSSFLSAWISTCLFVDKNRAFPYTSVRLWPIVWTVGTPMTVSQSKLERIFDKNPTSIVFARLADELLQQGDVGRATEVCKKGLKYRPSYATGHVVLGGCYLASNRVEEARQEFHKVLHLDANHLSALWHLGRIEKGLGWTEASTAHFEQALELDPFNSELELEVRGSGGQRFTEVEEEHEEDLDGIVSEASAGTSSLDAEPDPDAPIENLVREITQIENSGSTSQNVLEIEPIITPTLAEIYAAQGLIRQAVDIFEQLCRRDPDNEVVKARLEAYRASGGT